MVVTPLDEVGLIPAIKVGGTESTLEGELGDPFTTDLEVDVIKVRRIGHILGVIAPEPWIRNIFGASRIDVLDTCPGAKQTDGLVPYILVELAQFLHSLGIVEEYLSIAEDRKRVVVDRVLEVVLVRDTPLDHHVSGLAESKVDVLVGVFA